MPYQPGDIVVTLFPFSDGPFYKERPALICAGPWRITPNIEVCWVAMITTTVLKGWPGDVEIPNLAKAGLPVESIVRSLKLTCIDTATTTKKAGMLDTRTLQKVLKHIKSHLEK